MPFMFLCCGLTGFIKASNMFPVLQRYEANWATSALVQQYLQSRRKSLTSAGIIACRQIRLAGTAEERKERAKKANACRRQGRQRRAQRAQDVGENLDPALRQPGNAGN